MPYRSVVKYILPYQEVQLKTSYKIPNLDSFLLLFDGKIAQTKYQHQLSDLISINLADFYLAEVFGISYTLPMIKIKMSKESKNATKIYLMGFKKKIKKLRKIVKLLQKLEVLVEELIVTELETVNEPFTVTSLVDDRYPNLKDLLTNTPLANVKVSILMDDGETMDYLLSTVLTVETPYITSSINKIEKLVGNVEKLLEDMAQKKISYKFLIGA